MARLSLHFDAGDQARAEIGKTRYGLYLNLAVGGAVIFVPGEDGDAVVNARQWATALTEAADQIVAKLEAETVAEVV